MKYIAHRGNTMGPCPELENTATYIESALMLGFDVEIDVWYQYGEFYLGHDEPKENVTAEFLAKDGVWCHAKNTQALREMLKFEGINCFFHDTDACTLTSKGQIWSYPTNKDLTELSVVVCPEMANAGRVLSSMPKAFQDSYGLCSDYVGVYKKLYGSFVKRTVYVPKYPEFVDINVALADLTGSSND